MSDILEKPVVYDPSSKKTKTAKAGTGHGRLRIVSIIAIAISTCALIGIGVLAWQKKHNAPEEMKIVGIVEKDPSVEKEPVDKVNQLLAQGKSQDASQVVSSDPSLKDSRDGQMLAAQVALDGAKYDEAITIYTAIAAKYGWTANIADQLAQCYEMKNDRAGQIMYYQKELELLQKDTKDIAKQTKIDRVQAKLKELQS